MRRARKGKGGAYTQQGFMLGYKLVKYSILFVVYQMILSPRERVALKAAKSSNSRKRYWHVS